MPALSQPACVSETESIINDSAALQGQMTVNGKPTRGEGDETVTLHFVSQCLPPEDLSLLPRHHVVCDSAATLLRGASWEGKMERERE